MQTVQDQRDQGLPAPSGAAAPPSSLGRKWAAAAILLAGFCFIGLLYATALKGKKPGLEGDYIGYWASGQQLIHHANPFDAATLQRIETAAGYNRVTPSITPSPPVTFLLLLPLGLISAWPGLVFWGMVMVAALAASVWMLWVLNGRPDTLLPLFCLLYAPALVCILGGQIGIFFLISVTTFLFFVERHPLLAGAALLPCVMKPHLFLALAIVLLLWSIHRRQVRVLAGLALALAVSTAVTLCFDPHVFAHYAQSLRDTDVSERITPTFSVLLRNIVSIKTAWLEFLPSGLACVWAVLYYAYRRERWSWMQEGLLVLLVALLCAPYSWYSDQAVLLPAVMTALLRARAAGRPLWRFAVIAALEIGLVLVRADIKTFAYAWAAPAWFFSYLWATQVSARKTAPVVAVAESSQ